MAEEQKEQKMTSFIDSTFKLVEIHDEMNNTIANFETIMKKQQHLIDVLKAANEKDLDDVIAQMQEKLETYTKMHKCQCYRKDCIEKVLGIMQHTNDVHLRFALSMLLEALGLVNSECLPIEERSDYDEPKEEEKPVEDKA